MISLTHDPVLTDFDHKRLHALLHVLRQRSGANPWNLHALELELSRARTVAREAIASDVITMNSTIRVQDLASGQLSRLTLVFPGATGGAGQSVPVLSPLGLSLLGSRVGQTVTNATASGPRQLRIEAVEYQPEATGNYAF